ncbi:MAG: PaaI family thioesterase [Candidatus Methanoplasma sp.]|nr:PaaI family thioesterase [Candidatus Methanoplasma sp.]
MDIEALKSVVSPDLHNYLNNILEMCNAPYATANGLELVSADISTVRMRMAVRPEHMNSNGVVHGAATYGLLDHTFAIACNITEPTVGMNCAIMYHRPCRGGVMESESQVINESKSVITVDVKVRSGGKLIASAQCIGFKMRMK